MISNHLLMLNKYIDPNLGTITYINRSLIVDNGKILADITVDNLKHTITCLNKIKDDGGYIGYVHERYLSFQKFTGFIRIGCQLIKYPIANKIINFIREQGEEINNIIVPENISKC